MSEIENGNVEVMGININISQIFGNKIIDQYMSRLSEEDINKILDYIDHEIFLTQYTKYGKEKIVRKEINTHTYSSNNKTMLGYIQDEFNNRFKSTILEKVDALIASDTYQQRATEIAEELVEYATEGYKEDMKNRLRERLINNMTETYPSYAATDLKSIINMLIDERINGGKY